MRATRKKTWFFVGAVLTLSAATVACSAILGLEPPPNVADGDGGSDASNVDAAGGCMIRYVNASTVGDDSHSGCTPDAPMKSIKAAIAAYENAGISGYTVQVCRGTYPETDLRIQSHGSVLGGFSCDSWTRKSTYATDAVNETTITVASPDSNHEVPLLVGPSIVDAGVGADAAVPEGGTSSLLVDGFSIQGPSDTPESYAIRVNQGATGVISNCRLLAGDATNLSAGVFVQTSSIQIANNTILSGTAAVAVGIDVQTTGTAPYIHNNVVTSKDSTDGTVTTNGSFGILVNGTGNNADGNRIDDNTVISGNGILSAAIKLSGTSKGFVRRNKAQTLTASKAPSLGPMRGISLDSCSNVQILQNRVYSGGNGGVGPYFGIFVYKGANVVVANNMVYGGYEKPIPSGSDLSATGIALVGTKSPVAVYNTVFSGFSPGAGSRAYDLAITTSSVDGSTTTNAIIQNNVFAGSGVNDFGVIVDNCSNGIDTFQNNVFFAQQTGIAFLSCADAGATRNVQDMAGLGRLGARTLDDNLALRSADTCGKTDDGGGCIVQDACIFYGTTTTGDGGQNLNGNQACVDSVFGAWSNADDGFTTLFNAGWTLGPTAPCAVAQGALDLAADGGITTDLYGKQRDAAPSMGAAQTTNPCQ